MADELDHRPPPGVQDARREDVALLDAVPVPLLVARADGRQLVWVNRAALRFYGHGREVLLRMCVEDLRAEAGDGAAAPGAGPLPHRTASGERRMVATAASPIVYDGCDALLIAVTDVTEHHRVREEARLANEFLRQLVDQVPSAVSAKDMAEGGRYIIYNRANEVLFGRSRREMLGRTAHDVFDAEQANVFVRQDQTALRLGLIETVEDETIRRPDGGIRHVRARKVALSDGRDARPRYVVGVFEDVTDRRASEARVAHMAHHDGLTDLPNRFLFRERLASALRRAQDARESLAVLYIDLDGFKAVNDGWGHAAGDRLLQAVADRLRGALRACDTAARLGGDEFAVLQAPVGQPGEAASLAGRLVAALGAPYAIAGHDLLVSASVGVALARGRDVAQAELLQRADAALYRAKREGRNTYRLADAAPDDGPAALKGIAARMRRDGEGASPGTECEGPDPSVRDHGGAARAAMRSR